MTTKPCAGCDCLYQGRYKSKYCPVCKAEHERAYRKKYKAQHVDVTLAQAILHEPDDPPRRLRQPQRVTRWNVVTGKVEETIE